MSLTVTIDGVDVTDKVRLDSVKLAMTAMQGQVGTGAIRIDDTTGTADLAPIATEWSVTESDATPTTIAGGFVAERTIDKGPLTAGTQRQYRPVLEDWNTALTDRVLKGAGADRPEESDYARISWLVGQSAMGMLDGAGQVPNTDTVTMPATNYLGKYPIDVLDDCAEASGKNFYVYYESGTGWVLYYDLSTTSEAGFTSSLSISDNPADVDNSTVFGASDIDWTEDPERIYSGMLVQFEGGQVYQNLAATETTYRRLQRSVVKKNFTSATRAATWADNQLAKLNEPNKKLELTVSVPGSALGQLKAGNRIQVKLRSRGITAYTYFRIASTVIQPRAGRAGVSDVEYDVRLKMMDKIRPVNLDDDYGGGDSSGSYGTGSSTGTSWGDIGGDGGGGGGGSSAESGTYSLDDFSRDGGGGTFRSVGSAEGATSTPSGADTDVVINLPDGSDVVGRHLIAYVAAAPYNDMFDAMTGAGWTKLVPTAGSLWFYKRISGSEGYTGTSDTESITVTGATVVVAAVVDLLENLYDEYPTNPGPWWVANSGVTADPEDTPSPTSDGWDGEPARAYTLLENDGTVITGYPLSYTEVGEDTETGVRVRMDARDIAAAAAEDPSTYTTADVTISYTLVLRGGGVTGWGAIPSGGDAPWQGGNAWSITTSGSADVYVSSGVGYVDITSDDTTVALAVASDSPDDPSDEPWGPWAAGAAEFLVKFRVNPLGDTADANPNTLKLSVFDGSFRMNCIVHLGDNVNWSYMSPDQQRGIVLTSGTSGASLFAPKTLAANTWYFLRWDFRSRTMKAKLWAASANEPVAWDVTLSKVDESLPDEASFVITIDANDGMLFSFDSIDATLGSGSDLLPPGDGATVTWTIRPWTPGSLRVYVDGIQTAPASKDRDAGTFTFDRAPDLGAVIRVEYTPA